MVDRILPETANRPDWPRLVAQVVNRLSNRVSGLERFSLPNLADYADDTAAATGGVAVGGFYRTGSVIKVRVS